MTRSIGPPRKRQSGFFLLAPTACFWRSVLRLRVGGAAMFAEPAVTKIEEMVCLIHQDEAGTPTR